jgi:hypothetical protein
MRQAVSEAHNIEQAAALVNARLRELQRPSGAWAAASAGPDAVEPTALAALALGRSARRGDDVGRATGWLIARQRPDGSWPVTTQVDAPSWAGGVALLALARLRADTTVMLRGATWLVGRQALRLPWLARVRARLERWRGAVDEVELDLSLRGWPWIDGTYGWVEPTSVALMALRAAGAVAPAVLQAADVADRLQDGHRVLVDRAVPTGGWNYGNSRVLGEELAAYPDTTAWALLALRGVPTAQAVVVRALDRLPVLLGETRSSLARSLAALALRAHGRDDRPVRAALAARVLADGPPVEVRTQALALLALAGPSLPFEV